MGQSVANNDVVVDNGIEGWAGVRSSSAIQASVMARRKPLMVRPNMTQRIYLLHSTGMGCVVADTVSLRAWYRPRGVSYERGFAGRGFTIEVFAQE